MKVQLWKHVGGYIRLLKIYGRWYYLGDKPHDLRDWMARYPWVSVVREGGEAVVRAAVRKHGGTIGTYAKAFPSVTDSPMP